MLVKLNGEAILRNDPERTGCGVSLVTGVGSGIGRPEALIFGRQGAAIALVGRQVSDLEAAAKEVAVSGRAAMLAQADVADERAVQNAIGAVVEQLGKLNIAFNNASVTAYEPSGDLTTNNVNLVLTTNVASSPDTGPPFKNLAIPFWGMIGGRMYNYFAKQSGRGGDMATNY